MDAISSISDEAIKILDKKIEAIRKKTLAKINSAKTDFELYELLEFFQPAPTKTAKFLIEKIENKREVVLKNGALPAHIRDFMCKDCLGSKELDALYRGDFSTINRIGFSRKVHQVFFEEQNSFFQGSIPKNYEKVSFTVSIESDGVTTDSENYTFYISPLNAEDYRDYVNADDYKLLSSRRYFKKAPNSIFNWCKEINHPVLVTIRENFHRYLNKMEPIKPYKNR